ncbi:MATE family efflux transporter [Evansella cellulosilytica]|uniref:Multidrug export protein MepA n=1 Tax=Evansella cellulosilytica (strain ATCC 21833 / DSM 2522 / FERM P-1141 / JCM 9156 / N-4) TaxID=649639 RepID=E6TUZ3_EVAC2|nr:MATE family efflux transporter [Evansella cellulosilytica]ADU28576.1 MATE efflux family protein [Evansella cellulosilytica DSM 2522]
MDQKQQSERLGTEPISKLLRRLSIPAMIGMFVMALYNVVDTIFISYFVGITGVAAVTIAFPLMMIMMAIAAALGVGGASVISRRLGERREEDANKVFGNILLLVIVVSIFGMIGAFTFLDQLLYLFGATDNIIGPARDYMLPIMLGTFFFSFGFTTNAIIRSEGNARFAMMMMIIPSILNILLDPIFIVVLDMGVQGAAIATVISQAFVTIYVLRYFISGKSTLTISIANMKPHFALIKEVITVGLPAFFRQVAGSVMMIAINAMLIQFGSEFHVGVFGIVQRVLMFTLMPMMGILQGMQPMIGYNYGAKNITRLQDTIWLGLKVVTVYSAIVFVVVMTIPELFMRIFTSDQEVIQSGAEGMRIMFAAAILIGAQVVSGGLYQALGKAKPALILSMARQVLFLIPLVLILPHFFGVKGVWIAFPIADILSFALSAAFLYRDRKLFFIKSKDNSDHDTLGTERVVSS